MGTPAQIGKQQYNAVLRDARESNLKMRRILRRLMEEAPSSMIKALVGQAAVELGDIDNAIYQLDQIGKNSKTKAE